MAFGALKPIAKFAPNMEGAADSPPSHSLGPLALLARLAAEALAVRRQAAAQTGGSRTVVIITMGPKEEDDL